MKIIVITSLLLIPVACLSQDPSGCMGNWIKLGSVCYHFDNANSMKWDAAQESCMNSGGILAEPLTEDENARILEHMHSIGCVASWWFGLRRWSGDEFRFHSTNQTLSYNTWGKDQPDNYQNRENCTTYRCYSYAESFLWNDKSCSDSASFICQEKVSPTATTRTTSTNTTTTTNTTTLAVKTTTNSDSVTEQLVTATISLSTQSVTHAESTGVSQGSWVPSLVLGTVMLILRLRW